MRRVITFTALVSVLALSAISRAETIIRPDTTSSVMIAEGDSLFALPGAMARAFDINDLPDVETVVSANAVINLGDSYKAEFYSFGTSPAGGVYFRTVTSGATRTVYAHVFIGAADSVSINAWQY